MAIKQHFMVDGGSDGKVDIAIGLLAEGLDHDQAVKVMEELHDRVDAAIAALVHAENKSTDVQKLIEEVGEYAEAKVKSFLEKKNAA